MCKTREYGQWCWDGAVWWQTVAPSRWFIPHSAVESLGRTPESHGMLWANRIQVKQKILNEVYKKANKGETPLHVVCATFSLNLKAVPTLSGTVTPTGFLSSFLPGL